MFKMFVARLIEDERTQRQGAILKAATKNTLRPLATNDMDSDSASDREMIEQEVPDEGLQLLGAGDSSSGSSAASGDDEDSTIGDGVHAV